MTKSPKTKLYNQNNLSDVWRVVPTHKRKETGHIAVMPVDVAKNILESVEGNVVLDPFMGSGTTAIAALNANRSYIGFELDKDYYNIAQDRINNHEQQLSLI